jgi:hypothetical protein
MLFYLLSRVKTWNLRPKLVLSFQPSRTLGVKMFKSIIAIAITTVATAGLMAGLMAFSTSVVPEAKAEAQVMDAFHQPYAKGNRLAVPPRGAACSSRGWPYYEQGCQFDLRKPADESRTVRVIALR